MASETVPIESLLLDVENPRHDAVTSQRDAIQAVIEEQGGKLSNLVRDIADHGLSPLDRVLVFKKGRSWVVVEGNRRVVALKLLRNPDLAAGTAIEREVRKIAASAQDVPSAIECGVIGSREDARHWVELRHTGEQEGRGVVSWNALAAARFNTKPGTATAKAVTFVDTVQSAFPTNTRIQSALETISKTRLTTLGRLIADRDFNDHLGLEQDDGRLLAHFPASEIEPILERVLEDLATHLSVTKIKTKDMRRRYISSLPKPKSAAYRNEPQALDPKQSGAARTSRSVRQQKPGSPFKDLSLQRLDQRINDIVGELRKLDLEKFPNAAAVLTRVLLELAVDQFIQKKSLQAQGKLKEKLRRCLGVVDATDKDPKYQGVRAGLSDGTSMYAVATLHGYVHNQHFHPTATEVRNIVANLKPFLQAMNDLA
ncbi:MAG TPA: hypothetical protein VFL66_10815 [Gaiellaceae bacterium]|nr:hypothetical protein [Gaiellaceae bacterium]